MRDLDLKGKKFGRLHVLAREGKDRQGSSTWKCICDCGEEKVIRGCLLNTGRQKSCGCLQREAITKHGLYNHPLYTVWAGMIQRCSNKNQPSYKNYGARGIKVCKRWKNFKDFYNDMIEGYSSSLQIDRINNDGNYEPGNCRWVTRSQQNRNKRASQRKRGKIAFGPSGIIGVSFYKESKKWKAYVWIKGKNKYLGLFPTKEEASLRVKEEEEKNGIIRLA